MVHVLSGMFSNCELIVTVLQISSIKILAVIFACSRSFCRLFELVYIFQVNSSDFLKIQDGGSKDDRYTDI